MTLSVGQISDSKLKVHCMITYYLYKIEITVSECSILGVKTISINLQKEADKRPFSIIGITKSED